MTTKKIRKRRRAKTRAIRIFRSIKRAVFVFSNTEPKSELGSTSRFIWLVHVRDEAQSQTVQEHLRSKGINFSIQDESEILVPKRELGEAKAALKEGQWVHQKSA